MKFIKYFLLVLFVCISLLALIFVFFRKGYNTYFSFEQSRLKQIINGKGYYDALFVGSSRTYYHINPKIIDSVLNLRSFNGGIDGANLFEINMILKCYLASHPAPRYVIADLPASAFEIAEAPIWNPNIYFPFLNNEIVFNSLRPSKRVYLLKYLPFLQITEWDDFLRQGAFAGLAGKEKPLAPHYKGYLESGTDTIPLPFKMTYLTTDFPVNPDGTALLEEMIKICKKNNIRLVITYAPVYKLKDEKMNPAFFPTLKYICDTSHIPFLSYRYLSINNNHLLFRDEHHLNKHGADIFTTLLAEDLKNIEIEQAVTRPDEKILKVWR